MFKKTLTLGLAATMLAGMSLMTSAMPAQAQNCGNNNGFIGNNRFNSRINNAFLRNNGYNNGNFANTFGGRGSGASKFTPQQRQQRKIARKIQQQQVLQQQAIQQQLAAQQAAQQQALNNQLYYNSLQNGGYYNPGLYNASFNNGLLNNGLLNNGYLNGVNGLPYNFNNNQSFLGRLLNF